ncbi:hypothetical protein Mapa_017356 [Marchantia paleacea]|nr:hypothetical protein Mapa_017356 [Marchantia paleacea]
MEIWDSRCLVPWHRMKLDPCFSWHHDQLIMSFHFMPVFWIRVEQCQVLLRLVQFVVPISSTLVCSWLPVAKVVARIYRLQFAPIT